MKNFKEYRKITEFAGCRLRIMPTAFGKVETQLTNNPVDVLYADVTVVNPIDESETQNIGPMAIYQHILINQIKSWWDGRPITGTLRKRHMGERPSMPEVWILDDVEVA